MLTASVRVRWALLCFIVVVAAVTVTAGTSGNAFAGRTDSVLAVTDHGVVRGLRVDDVRQFRGIPYAAPPVGDRRWQPPQDAARWSGIRDASAFGPHCAQAGGTFGRASTSEDCLFLNVYLPKLAVPGLPIAPVMVWIHGGALVSGESDAYNPVDLVARGVVVVTINYRLGALGFLTHPALAAQSAHGAAGNYGLLDQQAALQWVQHNIRHFGGNPGNVTIFGESAGGLSVHSQLVSPLAAGLFDKAIVQSGAYQPNQASLATAEVTGSAFATRAGCTDQTAACLRGLPVATVLANQNGTIAAPTVDGFVLTNSIAPSLQAGTFNQVPIIQGSNHDEWRLFVGLTETATHTPLTEAGYIPAIAQTLGLPIPAATALAARYPLSAYPSPSLALGALGTDIIFACNARRLAQSLSAHVRVYQYEFNDPFAPMRFLANLSFPTGAYHAAEIQYLFDTPSTVPTSGLGVDQQKLSETMVRYWTTFAWTGSPNSFGTPLWPRYDENLRHQELVPGRSFTATNFATDHQCT